MYNRSNVFPVTRLTTITLSAVYTSPAADGMRATGQRAHAIPSVDTLPAGPWAVVTMHVVAITEHQPHSCKALWQGICTTERLEQTSLALFNIIPVLMFV